MQWITATDLHQWGKTRNFQGTLPYLIRKLIRASVDSIKYIRFPCGDSIQLHGWDGRLETTFENEFVPSGLSLWEMSSRQDVPAKFNEDYVARSRNPLGYDPKKATLVLVTPHSWEGIDNWRLEKMKDGIWKEIKIIDGQSLEDWLDTKPSVAAWLAYYQKKAPQDADSLENFWAEWSYHQKTPFVPDILIAGRSRQFDMFSGSLSGHPSIIPIKGVSREESLAFAVAAIDFFEPGIKEHVLANSMIIRNEQSFRVIANNQNHLILFTDFKNTDFCNFAISKGHHVVVPLGADDNTDYSETVIVLPRPDREEFVSGLQKMGLSKEKAESLSKETARNITILRRKLGFSFFNKSDWAKKENVRQLIPAILAGSWDESVPGDRKIIEDISGIKYGDVIKQLSIWLKCSDPPVIKIGDKWKLTSSVDSWTQAGLYITTEDFSAFEKAALTVLSEIDPMFELEPEKRQMAAIYDKNRRYSGSLRTGLVQSLILIGVYGVNWNLNLRVPSQNWVDIIITLIFQEASPDKWRSLSIALPDLAEASPSAFLTAVEQSLNNPDKPIMSLFQEDTGLMTPVSYQPGLLWGLEGLAWTQEHLSRVAIILARLSEKDPGGKLVNRPINSLREIFLPWLPKTNASLQQRLEIIRSLLDKYPDTGWKLILGLLPSVHDVSMPTHKMRWRADCQLLKGVTNAEIWENQINLTEMAISAVGNSGVRIIELLDHTDHLHPQSFKSILTRLLEISGSIIQNNFNVWNALRKKISAHRSHSKAQWALPETYLQDLESLMMKIEQPDTFNRILWLFNDQMPELLEGFPDDSYYSIRQDIILQRRIAAYDSIYSEIRFEGVLRLIRSADLSWSVGQAAAHVSIDQKKIDQILSLLSSDEDKIIQFVRAFIRNKELINGFDWAVDTFQKLRQRGLTNEVLNKFLLPLIERPCLWDLIESVDKNLAEEYWKYCYGVLHDVPNDKREYAIDKLLLSNRPKTACYAASHCMDVLSTELLVKILRSYATQNSDEINRVSQWEIDQLFETLDARPDCNRSDLVELEWLYFPILKSIGHPRSFKILHNELSEKPDFFAELMRYVYKGKDELKTDENIIDSEKKQLWRISYDLLSSWNGCPGTSESNQIDHTILYDWITKAHDITLEDGRQEVADLHIGYALARSREYADCWPQEAVCRVIDDLNIEEINRGFVSGTCQKRGVSSHGAFEGGDQERALAQSFRDKASNIRDKWPITASLLEEVARDYDADAKRHDQRAEEADLEQ